MVFDVISYYEEAVHQRAAKAGGGNSGRLRTNAAGL
jgi:hypothetical protein